MLHSSPRFLHCLPLFLPSTFLIEQGMANTMVSVRSSELGPLGWDAVTKRRLFLQKVSSKLGPGARQQGRGTRQDRGPAGPAVPPGSGLSGHRSPGPRQAQGDGSTSREDGQGAGGGSPTRAKQIPTQSQGESKRFRDARRSSFNTLAS